MPTQGLTFRNAEKLAGIRRVTHELIKILVHLWDPFVQLRFRQAPSSSELWNRTSDKHQLFATKSLNFTPLNFTPWDLKFKLFDPKPLATGNLVKVP